MVLKHIILSQYSFGEQENLACCFNALFLRSCFPEPEKQTYYIKTILTQVGKIGQKFWFTQYIF